MQKFRVLSLALFVVAGGCAQAQNTGATATPETRSAAPASSARDAVNPAPATPKPNNSSTFPSGSRRMGSKGGPRRGGTAVQSKATPAAKGNESVSVLGDSNGDGILDRSGKGADSAALPGIAMLHNALGIATGTPIVVRLQQAIDSGHAHNGDTVHGVLATALGKIPDGAPVSLTVVASAAAGQLSSSGTLSLQVVSINGEQVLSQIITAEGRQGATVLADDAPERGTDAVFTPDQPITLPAA